jgi:hypothetical protein
MLKKVQQFEPATQLKTVFDELQSAMLSAKAAIDRVEWLKNRMIEEAEAQQRSSEMMELYTEKEVAELFGIKEPQMADLRRRHNLPHCSFGKFPRYTKAQLIEICEILEVRPRKSGVSKNVNGARAALTRAA